MESEVTNDNGILSILLYSRSSFGAIVLYVRLGRGGDQERDIVASFSSTGVSLHFPVANAFAAVSQYLAEHGGTHRRP